MTDPLLELHDVSVDYDFGRHGKFRAVDRATLSIGHGETLGLVGESGSGKSTIGKAVLGLVPVASGRIVFEGEDITCCDRRRRRELTRELQVVFQDSRASLNPVRTIESTLGESLLARESGLSRGQVGDRVLEVLEQVGLPPESADRLPHEFSGGQRQRIGIARALIVRPRLIVCDEVVSSLDLSVQAQVLNLLDDLRAQSSLSYLFITHDMAVVRHVASRIAVLRHGRVIEVDDAWRITESDDPYTAMLVAAAPVPDPVAQRRRREEFVQLLSTATEELPSEEAAGVG